MDEMAEGPTIYINQQQQHTFCARLSTTDTDTDTKTMTDANILG